MKNLRANVAAALIAGSAAAFAQNPPAVGAAQAVRTTATVEAIDQA